MTPEILPHALRELRLAVIGLIGWTGLHLGGQGLTRSKASRASGRLKALETLARRLIWLIALRHLADTQPCHPGICASKYPGPRLLVLEDVSPGSPAASAMKEEDTDTAVEQVDFPRARRRYLALVPPVLTIASDGSGLDLSHLHGPSRPIPIQRLAARIAALQTVLDAPEAHAKRLARHLSRLRKNGDPAPVVLPVPKPRGVPPELSLLAGLIPAELSRALKAWDTS